MTPQKAKKYSNIIRGKLSPFCYKINIVGSVLMDVDFINKLEIICMPKIAYSWNEMYLFFNPIPFDIIKITKDKKYDNTFLKELKNIGTIEEINETKRYIKFITEEYLPIFIYLPISHDYFIQVAHKNGTEHYVRKHIISKLFKKGFCDSNLGIRKISDCYEERINGITSYLCVNDNGETPPVFKSELKYFDWLGINWIEPKLRITTFNSSSGWGKHTIKLKKYKGDLKTVHV